MNFFTFSEKEQSDRFKNNYERIAEERKVYTNNMSEMVKFKDNLEQNMYGQFLPILNSKQDKIKELEERIKELEEKAEKDDVIETKKSAPKVVHEISDSDDEEIEIENDSPSLLSVADESMNFNNSQNLLNL